MPDERDVTGAEREGDAAMSIRNLSDAQNPDEAKEFMARSLREAGIEDGQLPVDTFVENNYKTLYSDFQAYSSKSNNPFIQFLKFVQTNKKALLPLFVEPDNWNTIHNLLADDVIDIQQLNFTCPDIEQPKPLLNEDFYEGVDYSDREWVMQLWNWCESDRPDNFIRYVPFRLLFVPGIEEVLRGMGNRDLNSEDMLRLAEKDEERHIDYSLWDRGDKDHKVTVLRRLIMFSSKTRPYIEWSKSVYETAGTTFRAADLLGKIQDTRNPSEKGNFAVSERFLTTAEMGQIIKAIGRDVDASTKNAASGRDKQRQGRGVDDTHDRRQSRSKSRWDRDVHLTSREEDRLISDYGLDSIIDAGRLFTMDNEGMETEIDKILDVVAARVERGQR